MRSAAAEPSGRVICEKNVIPARQILNIGLYHPYVLNMPRPTREVHAYPGRMRGRGRWPSGRGAGPCSAAGSSRRRALLDTPEGTQAGNAVAEQKAAGGNGAARRRGQPSWQAAKQAFQTPCAGGFCRSSPLRSKANPAEAGLAAGPPAPCLAVPLEILVGREKISHVRTGSSRSFRALLREPCRTRAAAHSFGRARVA